MLKTSKKQSIWATLSPQIATVASVDNIDMLQTHAAVYHGHNHRSYHGTTIQLVQPIAGSQQGDSLSIESGTENMRTNERRRPIDNSHSTSPHKLGKEGPKRRRTIMIHSSNYNTDYTISLFTKPIQFNTN